MNVLTDMFEPQFLRVGAMSAYMSLLSFVAFASSFPRLVT